MVLVFLLLLACLALAIAGELEKTSFPVGRGGGNCPGCGQPVEDDWMVCPRCRRLLQETCPGCQRQRAIFHRFCPWCGRHKEEPGQ